MGKASRRALRGSSVTLYADAASARERSRFAAGGELAAGPQAILRFRRQQPEELDSHLLESVAQQHKPVDCLVCILARFLQLHDERALLLDPLFHGSNMPNRTGRGPIHAGVLLKCSFLFAPPSGILPSRP